METTLIEAATLALASYRVTRFLTRDHLFSTVRERIFNLYPPESSKVGYLFTCEWCMSIWSSTALVGFATITDKTFMVAGILALSAVVGLLTAYEDR